MRTAIQQLRDKLIDISKRNPLIAYKHSERGANYVRIIDTTLNGLFEGLSGGGSMSFEPLPDTSVEPPDQRTPDFRLALEQARLIDKEYLTDLEKADGDPALFERAEQALVARVREQLGLPKLPSGKTPDLVSLARAHGVNPELELTSEGNAQPSDRKIRVLMLSDKLRTRLATISDRYQGHAKETGIHTLQVVLGFLEWRDKDDSEAVHYAPLLTLAVDLKPEPKAGFLKVVLAGRDEPLTVNMALAEMLRRFHDVTVPELGETTTPEQWFSSLGSLLPPMNGYAIRRWATLAVLPFPNMAIWRDLDVSEWPQLLEHEQLGLLLGGRERSREDIATNGLGFSPDYPIDEWGASKIPSLVLDADVSQHSTLVDATNRRSLAIEGPPGTGKSQTIANIIAGALSEGRRVLFVAEKQAALKVVGQRLEALGLGPLLLQLHSDRSTKGAVLSSLKKSLDLRASKSPPRSREVLAAREELVGFRDALRRYQSLLEKNVGEIGQSVGDLIWREMRLRGKVAEVLPRSVWDRGVANADRASPRLLAYLRQLLTDIEEAARIIQVAHTANSSWRAGRRLPTNPIEQQDTLDRLGRVIEASTKLSE